MKKEVFLAISIGFVLGLVITFGIWTANNSLKNLPQSKPSPTPGPTMPAAVTVSPTAAPQSLHSFPLTITSPADESLVSKPALKISGSTAPGAAVALVYETGEQIVQADASGNFSADITLEGGYNVITITAYDKSGQSSTQDLTVTYSTSVI